MEVLNRFLAIFSMSFSLTPGTWEQLFAFEPSILEAVLVLSIAAIFSSVSQSLMLFLNRVRPGRFVFSLI
ncbi:MAG: hypothetical protein ACLFR1_15505, partial [Spirochaetia bacterium]